MVFRCQLDVNYITAMEAFFGKDMILTLGSGLDCLDVRVALKMLILPGSKHFLVDNPDFLNI